MKILLIHPQWLDTYGNYKAAARRGVFYPPLGIMYIGTLLKQKGHEVRLIDSEAEGKTIKDILEDLKNFSPDLVGITSTTPIYHQAKKLAQKIKEIIQVPIVIGGAHACVMREKTLEDCESFDYLVYGEGEITTLELVEALQGKKELKTIRGLVYRKNGNIIKNPPREFIKDLDSLPIPDRSLIKNEKYMWSAPGKGIVKTTSIMATRGCPFHCLYCSQRNVFGETLRYRSADHVLKEIEEIINKYGINHLTFLDDNLTINRKLMMDLANKIIERKIKITFEGSTRANLVDEELLIKLKEAGLRRISFGIESGNQRILEVIKKGVTLEEIRKAYKIAKKVGLETRGSAMIGLPTETTKEVMDTLNFIKSLDDCDQIYLNITTPYPGTELSRMAEAGEGGIRLLSKDYSEYRRYGKPVIEVNDLTVKKLIKLQKKGFKMFYFTPRRIYYNLKRAGLKAGIKNAIAFAKSVFK